MEGGGGGKRGARVAEGEGARYTLVCTVVVVAAMVAVVAVAAAGPELGSAD